MIHGNDSGEIDTTASATVVTSAPTAHDKDAHLANSEGDRVKGGREGCVGHHDARHLFFVSVDDQRMLES